MANVTDVNDKIYDAARAAGVPSEQLAREMTARYEADTERPRARAPRRRAEGQRDDRADRRPDRRADRRRPRLRRRGRRLLPRRELPRLRQALEPPARGDGPGRGRRRALKESPRDFALWKARKEGEDTCVAGAVGRRPPRLAHRVLGHGRGAPGRRLRRARRRQRPDLPPPRERDRPDRGCARAAARAHLDAQRDAAVRPGEDVEVGGQHPPRSPVRSTEFGRDALVMYFVAGPLPPAGGLLAGQARPGAGAPSSACASWSAGSTSATRPGRPRRASRPSASSTRWPTTSTRPPRCAALFGWVGEANRRLDAGERFGPGALRDMLHALGLENLLDEPPSAVDAEAERLLAERERARAARDFAAADARARRAGRARLAGARHARRARSLVRRG